jgi:hypothetical protein
MRALWKTLTSLIVAGLLLLAVQGASAQKPKPMPAQPAPPMAQTPAQSKVEVVEPVRVFDPFFSYPYPYAYPPDYMAGKLRIRENQDRS